MQLENVKSRTARVRCEKVPRVL